MFAPFVCAFNLISPEFSYRPGLSVLSEDTANIAAPAHGAGGAPNRPLPPTPDDDDQQGDRTLIMKRVSQSMSIIVFGPFICIHAMVILLVQNKQ